MVQCEQQDRAGPGSCPGGVLQPAACPAQYWTPWAPAAKQNRRVVALKQQM